MLTGIRRIAVLCLLCGRVHADTSCYFFFFFNDPSPPEFYTLSLHDALPILLRACCGSSVFLAIGFLLELSKILLDTNVNVNLHLHYAKQARAGTCFWGALPHR